MIEDTEALLMRLQRKLLNGGYDDYLTSKQSSVGSPGAGNSGQRVDSLSTEPYIRSVHLRTSSR